MENNLFQSVGCRAAVRLPLFLAPEGPGCVADINKSPYSRTLCGTGTAAPCAGE